MRVIGLLNMYPLHYVVMNLSELTKNETFLSYILEGPLTVGSLFQVFPSLV